MKTHYSAGPLSTLRKSRIYIIPILLAVMIPLSVTGCYGAFPLTHALYDFNGDISHQRIIQTVTFWVFVIIPVYQIGIFVDAVIFNLIEFWTGERILSVEPTTDSNGNTVTLTPTEDGQQAVLTISRDGKVLAQEFFVKVSDTTFDVKDANGTLQGKVLKNPDGTISLTDRNCIVVRTLPKGALAGM